MVESPWTKPTAYIVSMNSRQLRQLHIAAS
jgi:hypothetical protein